MTEKITTKMIDDALRKRYTEPEWQLGFEVSNSTGALSKRAADAIAICPYPSRGFETIGFEVKISRSDLKRELGDPSKCEEMYQFTNEWFLVVLKGLCDGMDIPEPWGIIEYVDGKLKQKRKAKRHDSIVTTGFLCSFVRGVERARSNNEQDIRDEIRKEVEESMKWQESHCLKELNATREQIKKFQSATGLIITNDWETKKSIEIIKVAKSLHKNLRLQSGAWNAIAMLQGEIKNLEGSIKDISSAFDDVQTLLGDYHEQS